MDFGAFLLFGCVALGFLIYIPFVILSVVRKSSHSRRHIVSAVAVASLLLMLGAFIRQAYFLGEPLASAASEENVQEVQILLSQGAFPNASGVDGITTALVGASASGHSRIVQILLAQGADVNRRDSQGKTALQAASEGGYGDIAQTLKKAGAR